ncbi:MAG: hypothetical protein IEMM0006_1770 [bacterium]|nr:MAG: hypothetical protein IEMM0006_1770 [bacterium]
MRKFVSTLFLVLIFSGVQLEAQNFVTLKAGKTTQINNIAVSYIAAIKKTKKGEDLYRVTISITNRGGVFQRIFSRAVKTFRKTDNNALAYFQFVNATGRAFSAISGKLYAQPLTIEMPYKCRKCPPPADKKKDLYNHYVKSYIIGTQFQSGTTLTGTYNIRVSRGVTPVVRVMIR